MAWRSGLPIPEKVVRLDFPRKPELKAELLEDLRKMGCDGLFNVPWDISDDRLLQEVCIGKAPQEFRDHRLRTHPKAWKETQWRATYGFPNSPNGFDKSKGDAGLRKKFSRPPLDKDGLKVEDYRNDRERRLLRFLVPIFSPHKPTTCTLKLAKAIYESYWGNRECG